MHNLKDQKVKADSVLIGISEALRTTLREPPAWTLFNRTILEATIEENRILKSGRQGNKVKVDIISEEDSDEDSDNDRS